MKKSLRLTFSILIVALVAAGLVYLVWSFLGGQSAMTNNGLDSAQFVKYVNAQGQDWYLQQGDIEFKVSSAEEYPRFISGFINPLDVKVGDIQEMKVIINSDVDLTEVKAEIETDNGIKDLELELSEQNSLFSSKAVHPPFKVEGDILTLESYEPDQSVATLTKTARAEHEATQYVFTGSWEVEDTHTRRYQTKFIATDSLGRTDTLTLAWSDPDCPFSPTGLLQESCGPTSGIQGVDNVNLELPSGNNILLQGTSKLVFNPGKKIVLNGGSVILQGGIIKETGICTTDGDGDGYAPSSFSRVECNVDMIDPGYSRAYITEPRSSDCDDTDAAAYPGQSKYWSRAGNVKGDFNCDGTGYHYWARKNSTYDSSGYPSYETNGTVCFYAYGATQYLFADDYACGYAATYYTGSVYVASGIGCSTFIFQGSPVNICR